MNNIFDWIDKYKFGLIAMVAGYIFIFSYLQVTSYTAYYPISPFQEGPQIVADEEEIELEQENIQVPPDFSGEVKNISRDRNDSREKSMDNWSESQPSSGEQYAKDMEKKFFEETGGEAKREAIRRQAEAQKKEQEKNKKNASKDPQKTSTSGSDKAYAGNVMVDWELSGRTSSRLPIPGYMCGVGAAGLIVVDISVNQSGNVVSAKYNASASSSSNPCMVEQARNYALKSRFNYSGSASNAQSGKIFYTFVSQ